MNRQEFMKRLEELLTDISPEEKEEALAYYTGYFEDAGEENEEKIIQELESPEQLAASIKAGLREDGTGEYTERGYRMAQEAHNQQQFGNQQYSYNSGSASTSQPPKNNALTIILIVIIAAVTFPVWGGLLGGLFGLVIGFFGIMLGIVATLFGLTIGGLIGGFAVFGAGIVRLCTGGLASGLLMMGIGALMVAIGILFLVLAVLFCGQFLPWLIRGFVKICRMPFERRKEGCRI